MNATPLFPPGSNPILAEWCATWLIGQLRHSQHPPVFWLEVAGALQDGRRQFDNNPLVPIGRYALNWPGALEALVERNNIAIAAEARGDLLTAIFGYEVSVADEFFGTHPYDRLRIHYTREQWYTDAVRVCQAYIALPNREHGQNKTHFEHHLVKLRARLETSTP
ncbi:MAG: hypothetical protein NTU85_03545 [Candidatus Kaiserbacteria bacterium]|nr:hypothetical protein [Candidatus Kaiserbacteria bacterium]